MSETLSVSGHTPGPWKLADIYQGPYIVGADGSAIAQIVHGHRKRLTEQEYDNACLIIAAPDLLEALRGMLRATDFDDREPWVVQANAAIAKATGAK